MWCSNSLRSAKKSAPSRISSVRSLPIRAVTSTRAISRAGRPPLSTEALGKAPDTEKAAAFQSYFHYAGRWELDGDTVIHHVTLALNPNFPASSQRRLASLEGDRLTLATSDRVAGVTRTHRLRWRRVQR